MARTATAFVIQPLELFRVRVQGGPGAAANTSYPQQLAQVVRQIHSEGQVRCFLPQTSYFEKLCKLGSGSSWEWKQL
jgi:hypothetical protein